MTRRIAIDAHPVGPHGPLADEPFQGISILDRLIGQVNGLGSVVVYGEERAVAGWRGRPAQGVDYRCGVPPTTDLVLRTDLLYDGSRLRRLIGRGHSTDGAIVWRLDRPGALEHAADEVIRRRSYQPLGRFWAWTPAKRLAEILAPTVVRPNAVTVAAFALMVAAAGLIAGLSGGIVVRFATAGCLALALVLDTADGHLARIQNTASPFGKWLDALLDETADLLLHAAIAWASFLATGQAAWLLIGMTYAGGKYVFLVATQDGAPGLPTLSASKVTPQTGRVAKVVRLIGHADIRWHAWIVLALIGGLHWELAAFAAYYPTRTAAMLVRRALRHA